MVDGNYINMTYIQKPDTCVLSSYAIVNHYFTRLQEDVIFGSYCKHFGLKGTQDLSTRYNSHFHKYIRHQAITGYECIINLHQQSTQRAFVKGRELFNETYFTDTLSNIDAIATILMEEESLINLTFRHGNGHHSITIFCDVNDSLFKIRDTESQALTTQHTFGEIIEELQTTRGFQICDSVLFRKN